jgi:pimeloyl-ACP methyl ester carboxylesterase
VRFIPAAAPLLSLLVSDTLPAQHHSSVQPPTLAAVTSDVRVGPAEALRVTSMGSGDVVVLIPGLFGSAYGYRKLLPELASAGYRAVVIEPLGIGSSSRPKNADYSLGAQTIRVSAVLDSMHIASALVVSHAIGSSIAFRLAAGRPSLVRGIVSIEGGIAETTATTGFKRAMTLAPLLKLFGAKSILRSKIKSSFIQNSGDNSWVTDSVMSGYLAPALNQFNATVDALHAMTRAKEQQALGPRLHQVTAPVELLQGTAPHDGDVGDDELGVMRQKIPSLVVTDVKGSGHFIQEEQPDAVVQAVRRVAHRAGMHER